jgi:GNAT superfamily N-acetyltransferase
VIIVEAATPAHLQAVRELWTAYWNDLGFTPCFQGFESELASLPGRYAPPSGRLLIAFEGEQAAGAVAFRALDTTTCEAKRLYVQRGFRGRRIGEALMYRLFDEACAAGYSRVVGDTLPVMATALAMYDRLGFKRIPAYPGATDGAIAIEYNLRAQA